VLTRDRDALLVECLRGLFAQRRAVDRVIVLDNASSRPVAAALARAGMLDDPRLEVHRSEHNLGGAGGYHLGLKLAAAKPEDWIWLLDDDAEPTPEALERLLASRAAGDPGTVALGSAVRFPDGGIDAQHRCRLGRFAIPLGPEAYRPGADADVELASFVGLLVRRAAVKRIGLPRAEMFLGYDDADYSLRLRREGRIRLVPESVVIHKIPVGGAESTARSRVANRLVGAGYGSAPWSSYWKDLYRIRNFVWLRRTHTGMTPAGLALVVAGYLGRSLVYDQRPLRRLPWLLRFAWRGWRGDFAPEPSPADWARIASVRR